MRKLLVLVVVFGMFAAACGDSGSGGGDTCEGLVGEAMDLLQDVLDEIGDMSLEEAANFGDEPPESFQKFEEAGEDLEARSDTLGCTEAELNAAFNDQIDDLSADGPIAELILESIKAEGNPFSSGG